MSYTPPLNGGRINATIGGNTAGASTLVSNGTLTLAGGNNITLSQNGNAITISGAAAGAAGSQTLGISNLGNTIGTSGVISGSAVRMLFAGGNNVTLSQSINGSSGTITVSAANQTVQTQNLHNVTLSGNTAGVMAQVSSGTLTLAGGNNVTLSQNGNAVTISGPNTVAQSIQTQNLHNVTIGSNTAGVGAAISSGTLTLAGGDNITISQNGGNALTIHGGAGGAAGTNTLGISNLGNTSGTSGVITGTDLQLALAGGNNITLSQSINGSSATITISAGAAGGGAGTLSRWEYMEGVFSSLQTVPQGSLSINHMYVPFNVTGTAIKLGGSLSMNTNTSVTTASANISLWMGIYSLNGSSLSLASSGSANNGFQWSVSNSSTANTSVNSMRQLTVPMNVNMTPGQYWIAAVMSSATTYTGGAFTLYGNNLITPGATNAVLTPIGSGTTAARDVMLLQGIYTAVTSAGPISMSGGHINNTSASVVMRANFYNAIYNATY